LLRRFVKRILDKKAVTALFLRQMQVIHTCAISFLKKVLKNDYAFNIFVCNLFGQAHQRFTINRHTSS